VSKRAEKDELGAELEKLAVKITKALNSEPPKEGEEPQTEVTKIMSDMFGKLTSYYASTRKLNLKTPPEDDPEAPTFDRFRRTIDGTGAGNA